MHAELILHHYAGSHFSEKIRRVLAYKKMPWRAVEQPMMMPKPDLVPLTGGYRRIPVLQIGADVYCDSACIVRRLERLQPEPRCIPPGLAGLASMIEDWGSRRLALQTMPAAVVEMLPSLPPDILVDRAAMSPMMKKDVLVGFAPHAMTQALLSLDHLDAHLRDRQFLLGDTFSIADAACFFPVWLLQRTTLFSAVIARPGLAAWFARIESFGPGDVKPMATAEALAIARDAGPVDVGGREPAPTDGVALGDAVTITADDYGSEETRGTVARWTADEIAILRRDPALGDVAVHFPRAGYRIVRR